MSTFNTAEKLFYDNANYNSVLAAYHAKPKYKGILWGGKHVTPAEVLEKLEELGFSITQRTLQRYEKANLIPVPKRGSAGRGKGKFTDYPPETVIEAAVAYRLINEEKKPATIVAQARKIAQNKLKVRRNSVSKLFDAIDWKINAVALKNGFNIKSSSWAIAEKDFFSKQDLRGRNLDLIECGTLGRQPCPDGFCIDKYIREKYGLKEREDWSDDLDITCPYEARCIEMAQQKTIWTEVCLDFDLEIAKVKIYQRPPGTDDWSLVFEEKL